MAEITKISSPLVPKENVGNRYKPETDQAFELTNTSKVHKTAEDGKVREQQTNSQQLRDSFGRASIAALLKDTNDLTTVIKRLALLIETGVSTSEVMNDPEVKQMLESLYVLPEDVLDTILEQDKSAVLFKGEAFEVLRDLLAKFQDNPKIRDAVANLLKTFEFNVNVKDSLRTVLMNCENILDYMFSKDRTQFSAYLQGLAETLLPEEAAPQETLPQGTVPQEAAAQETPQPLPGEPLPPGTETAAAVPTQPGQTAAAGQQPPVFYNEDGQPIPDEIVRLYYDAEGNPLTRQTEPMFTDADGNPITPDAPPVFYDADGNPISPETMKQMMTGTPVPEQAPGQPPPAGEAGQTQQPQQSQQSQQSQPGQAAGQPQQTGQPQTEAAAERLPQKEIAQILKSNLLPLLGEIVVKYNQNTRIRDHVMVVVHNTVRVDQGTPEALRAAVNKLVQELRQVANLPENFARNLTESIMEQSRAVKAGGNEVMEKLVEVISETLRSEQSSPSVIRQAETLLMSLLQNQSSMMSVLHYLIPIQTPTEQIMMEMYVDPDYEEGRENDSKQSRKIFLSFESEAHGAYEMSFLQTEQYVDFQMWCPGALVRGLGGMKRFFADTMQVYGYTMNSFSVQEYLEPQSVVDVFPHLLNRKVGIDVRI
ncbi:hypothetical protein LJC63_12495 [Ruminococcaceae bacterium OttesenSCG-928-L11]|nr:hypothetical protein [Ruminococcaceae bacterium OttesenSCG-928-L11]